MKIFQKKRLVITVIIVLAVIIGASVYTATSSTKDHVATPSRVSHASTTKKFTSTSQSDSPAKPSTTESPVVPTQPTEATPKKTAPKPTSPSPPSTFTPPPTPLLFSAGRIDTSYTYCSGGSLGYTLGGGSISVNQPTSQTFSWRLELSDGTTSTTGSNTMPSGSTLWHNFPSTPTYPSMLGSIQNANDGDKARIVITSPNYSAGAWSNPVPSGSEEACRNGQM